jgi:hypothetical protein
MHLTPANARTAARTLTTWGAVLVVTAAAWSTRQAEAQTNSLPAEIVSAKQALTPEQRKTVAQFVEKQAQQFADADPSEVVQLRNEFLALLKKPTTAIGFRHDYGLEFVKGFKKFTEGDDSLRATNAFIMARFLATAESVDFLQDSLDPDTHKNIAVRIAASAQLPETRPSSGDATTTKQRARRSSAGKSRTVTTRLSASAPRLVARVRVPEIWSAARSSTW